MDNLTFQARSRSGFEVDSESVESGFESAFSFDLRNTVQQLSGSSENLRCGIIDETLLRRP
jgi:hypothetical protein